MKLESPTGGNVVDVPRRRVVLRGEEVSYRLIRARRRSIGMEVHLEGLTVRAPRWVTLRDVEAALVERAAWILRSLAAWRARRRDVMPREWKSNAPIAYRGDTLSLALYPSRSASIAADLFHLVVRHPCAQVEHGVAKSVIEWLRALATARVAPRVLQ
jgi:predicted metal-dependent hydrolase